jgi:uncharacterized membrane protein YkvA (DUF1232 family)
MFSQLKSLAKHIKQELAVYRLISKHPDTPWMAKLLFWLAVGYLLLPFDLIPDFIPILGQLDDAVIIPLLIYLALKLTPNAVIEYCRNNVN